MTDVSSIQTSQSDRIGAIAALIERIFLPSRHHIGDGPHAKAAAEKLINDQPSLRRRVLDVAYNTLSSARMPETSRAFQNLREYTSKSIDHKYQANVENGPTGYVVFSPLELIDVIGLEELERYIASHRQNENTAESLREREWIGALIVANFIERFRLPPDTLTLEQLPPLSLPLISSIAFLQSQKALQASEGEAAKSINATHAEALRIKDEVAGIEQELRTQQAQMTAAKAVVSEAIESAQNALRQLTEFTNSARQAEFLLEERLGLKATQELWDQRAISERRNYWGSLGILMAVLIITPLIIVVLFDHFNGLLSHLDASTIAAAKGDRVAAGALLVSRLVLVVAPMALIVWAIKLLVRFNMRSMLMMDDATQRVTMLNTYLFLISKEAATVQDRGALLEAMFRRAPGHGPDTIEPPSMTDILKYGDIGSTK